MTQAQCESAATILRAFMASGWARKMLGDKQMQSFRVALWALDQVAQAMAKEGA